MRKTTISIHLPYLTAEGAYMIATALDQIVSKIWLEYADAIIDFEGRAFPDGPPDPDEPPWPPDDIDWNGIDEIPI